MAASERAGEKRLLELGPQEIAGRNLWPVLAEMETRGWLEKVEVTSRGEELWVSLVLGEHVSERAAREAVEVLLGQQAREREAPAIQAVREGGGKEWAEAQTVRVEQAKIDRLLGLAGELIIESNGLLYLLRRLEGLGVSAEVVRELKERHARLSRISWDVQDAVMEMRLMPVGMVFERFRRVVREVGQELGKKVQFLTQGEEITIDRSVAAAIYDPLLHLVRNALDHGLEEPEERRRAGKPEAGKLLLAASRRGERILVKVEDDGRGMDLEAIREKAAARGWVPAEQAQRLRKEELLEFVFRPGFSTREAPSSLSGRGVGMDVVREAVQALGGRVSLETEPGCGTTVTMELPVTVSITKVLLFECGGLFGLPVGEVKEIVKVGRRRLREFKGRQFVPLRNAIYPVLRLSCLLGRGEGAASPDEEVTLLVLLGGLAVEVGKVLGEQDVVLKNLPPEVGAQRLFSGAAILGSGDIALILDAGELGGVALES
ncbi:chemotaxis protein CheA [Desulfovirgula thermocuniculi]|uniref:chemotaxis protein CheA n=1 Tax=Desulfovirgula thermocuniculi TaxID=348842 RepID=UPI0004203F09|nr:chemotaxis protein CheA [Desulfovirgula thermocuniculi]